MRKQTVIRSLPYFCAAILGAVAWLAPRVLRPEDTRRLAVCLALIGILFIPARDRNAILPLRRCTFADSLAFLLAGIAIFPRYRFIRTVFPVVTGVMLLTHGITSLYVSRYLGQCGDRKWILYALSSLLVIASSVYLLLALFHKTDPAIRTVGALMLGSALLKLLLRKQVDHLQEGL